MNKKELVSAMAEKSGLTKADNETALNAAMAVIEAALAAGEKVQLVGFGAFEIKSRPERIGHNPKTNEKMIVPASKAPVFKPGKALRAVIAG